MIIFLKIIFVIVSTYAFKCWLAIPLMLQVIIDKVISQNSIDTLGYLCFFTLAIIIIGSVSEYGSFIIFKSLTNRRKNNSKKSSINIKQGTELVKILFLFWIIFLYSPILASVSIIIVLIESTLLVYRLTKKRINNYPQNSNDIKNESYNTFPFYYYIMFAIYLILFVISFSLGSFLVLDGKLTLGQLIAFHLINLQLVLLSLNFTINLTRSNSSRSNSSNVKYFRSY